MGYCITQTESSFFIPKEHFHSALESIKASITNSRRELLWVDTDQVLTKTDLCSALRQLRWRASLNRDGDICDVSFQGEKSGDDDIIFRAIAPYVNEESYITMVGEDHATWRWYFDGQKCSTQNGRTVWE
jgi:hypothetical protein